MVLEDPSKKGDLDGCYEVSGDSERKCSDENLSSSPVNVYSDQIKNLDSLGRSRDGEKLEIEDSIIQQKWICMKILWALCGDGRATESQLSSLVAESLFSGSPHRDDLDVVVSNEIVSERALEDIQAMGLLNDNIMEECKMVSNYNEISWAAMVEMANGNMKVVKQD
ncbi:hypothetical protein V6N11_067728 [Hibiscus sabdariffa]|uniref:Uncharacterized protein n=1 Tax=Hibiscus sabdariffa TaxID=183260 RepID=A0ABR2SSK6_9ROSI